MKIIDIYNSKPLKTNLDTKETVNGNDFKSFLLDSIDKLNTYESNAKELGNMLATGEIDSIHEVTIASQKAEIALQFAIGVKNKVMDAYKEIMRMQV